MKIILWGLGEALGDMLGDMLGLALGGCDGSKDGGFVVSVWSTSVGETEGKAIRDVVGDVVHSPLLHVLVVCKTCGAW